MNKQIKLRIINISLAVIALISIIFNIYFVIEQSKSYQQDNVNSNQIFDVDETMIVDGDDNKQEDNLITIDKENDKESKPEYIYKYIEGKEKQVIVEKKVEKTIEVPASPTDATVTYKDATGNTKTINLPSGTTINFSAGEHGKYNTTPSPITLTDNQELDITDSSYNPSKVEVNYIFKGFSYSGDTMTCMYSLVNNIVNAECKVIENLISKNNVLYVQHDYIESTGTQYITTNLEPNGNDHFKIEFTPTAWSTNTNDVIFGVRRSGVAMDGVFCFGSLLPDYGNTTRVDNFGSSATMPSKLSLNNKHTIEINKNVVKIDTSTFTTTQSTKTQLSANMIIFAGVNIDSSPTSFTKMKLHSFVVYDSSGNVSENWVPIQRVSDNVTGLLNLVNGSFLGNSGSGVFNHPDIIYTSGVYAGRIIATGSYEAGSTSSLTVEVNEGYKFVKWSDGNTNTTRTVTVGNNIPYIALFVPNSNS